MLKALCVAAPPSDARNVRFGSRPPTPESGHVRCTRLCLIWANSGHRMTHSITSSARPISVFGTVMPSALAVLRLMKPRNGNRLCCVQRPQCGHHQFGSLDYGRTARTGHRDYRSIPGKEKRAIDKIQGPHKRQSHRTAITRTLIYQSDQGGRRVSGQQDHLVIASPYCVGML
jgi:hypothetical protein